MENGFGKLSEDPFDVYEAMQDIDPRTARLVLITLMSKTHEMARKGCSDEELIRYIQSEHYVNKKTAKDLAFMYLEVFSDENRKSWNDAEGAGFGEFCEKEWSLEWHGRNSQCFVEANLIFCCSGHREHALPFFRGTYSEFILSEDDLYRILKKQIEDDLDRDMEDFCNADDNYAPIFEKCVGEGIYDSYEIPIQ